MVRTIRNIEIFLLETNWIFIKKHEKLDVRSNQKKKKKREILLLQMVS